MILYEYIYIYYVNIMNNITSRNKHRLIIVLALHVHIIIIIIIYSPVFESFVRRYNIETADTRTYAYSNKNDDDNMFTVLTYLKVKHEAARIS